MKREIKFRGKDIETGEWIDGDLIQRMGYMPSIMFPYNSNGKVRYSECAVKRETVGQFTGLLDKNGEEIYEGDVIEIKEVGGYGCKRKGVVEYDVDDCAFVVRVLRPSWAGIARLSTRVQICADGNCTHEYINQYTVIGNIHDNPELLKTETL